ncbi:hypothetical protein NQZ79_g7516 [Umbelopsis isabellina]|nr:hypothetical protein NQZ79_g7516 [Umbelopsis isabellina]
MYCATRPQHQNIHVFMGFQMPFFKKPSSVGVSDSKSSPSRSSKPISSVKKTKSPKNPNEVLPPILSCTWGPVVPKTAIGR